MCDCGASEVSIVDVPTYVDKSTFMMNFKNELAYYAFFIP